MAESSTDGIQIRSDPEFDEFLTLLRGLLPPNFLGLLDDLRVDFETSPAFLRHWFIHLLRDRQTLYQLRDILGKPTTLQIQFRDILRSEPTTLASIFRALRSLASVAPRISPHAAFSAFPAGVPHADIETDVLQRYLNLTSNRFPGSEARNQSYPPRSQASLYSPPGHGRVDIIPTEGEFTDGHGTVGNSPGDQRAFVVTSNSLPDSAAHIQSYFPRPAAWLNNPPGHGGVIITPTYGEFTDGHGTVGNSPGDQRAFVVMSNSLPDSAAHIQSYSPRLVTSLNNPSGRRVIVIATDGEFTHGHGTIGNSPSRERAFIVTSNGLPNYADHIQSYPPGLVAPGHYGVGRIPANGDGDNGYVVTRILDEARTTRDDETARYSKMFKTLLPVNFTNAYKAGKILKSIYNSTLPLSIKTSGYLAVSSASVAVLSSLAGFSLTTLKPNTLPFGCNPQHVMHIMHDVGVHSTAYAFIGTMCHEFLQDYPFIMWTMAGFAYAAFMGLMTFIGRRGGQGTFRTGGDFSAV